MKRAARFVLLLVGGLGVLASIGYVTLVRTTRAWFEDDMLMRAKAAVAAAREGLDDSWNDDSEQLRAILSDLTQGEHIIGSAACAADGHTVAETQGYPSGFGCADVIPRLQREGELTRAWGESEELPSGRLYLSSVPVGGTPDTPQGVVLMVHDLRFLSAREDTTRNLLLAAFFVLAVCASGVTLLAARLAWRGWAHDLMRGLRGKATPQFQPLVRDVRKLVESLSHERDREARFGPWNPARLRATLTRHLRGERVVLLANREPYIHELTADGVKVMHPASGLVTALEPVMRACSGVWVAHGSGSADRQMTDEHGHVKVPPASLRDGDGDPPSRRPAHPKAQGSDQDGSYLLRRVWLTDAEEHGYYEGFSNEGLWPLCHLAHARPTFRAEDFAQYVAVNRRFADAVVEEVDADDPIVLVQDYHFSLAPKMIRERLPWATILTFWHIPWPNSEQLGICPWREEIIEGLLGSSIVGFHTQQHCNNFIDSVDAYVESRIDREADAVVQGAHRTLVRPYPISIEWPVRWLEKVPEVPECRAQVRQELGLAGDALLGVGIDRLDYTKGIEERLLAVDQLFSRHPSLRGRFTFVQLAAPSRTKIERYRELGERVEKVAEQVNARWGQSGRCPPIVLLRAHHEPPTVFKYYRAADLCYVSSLHDGMNLVAKEFVAARDDEQGVLVLSEFTGAARDLSEALIVNPYDLSQASDALAAALAMPVAEQRERMRSMRRLLAEFNVYQWAGRMLVDAAELRRRERMGRLHNWNHVPLGV